MSQLIDKLNRVARATPQSMGFRTAQAASPRPQMLLIARLAQTESADGPADYITGADGVLVHITKAGSGAKALQKMARPWHMPWGVWLKDTDEKTVGAIVEAGGDFVVFPAASTMSAIPRDGKVGKVLQIEPSLGEGLLRAINDLPVDAVLAADELKEGDSLTWHHLMLFQRAANLVAKPLLVSIPSRLSADELKTLWGIGIDGVVVDVGREAAGRLKELRQAIGELDTLPRRRGKTEALLPHISMGTSAETDEEEEE